MLIKNLTFVPKIRENITHRINERSVPKTKESIYRQEEEREKLGGRLRDTISSINDVSSSGALQITADCEKRDGKWDEGREEEVRKHTASKTAEDQKDFVGRSSCVPRACITNFFLDFNFRQISGKV